MEIRYESSLIFFATLGYLGPRDDAIRYAKAHDNMLNTLSDPGLLNVLKYKLSVLNFL